VVCGPRRPRRDEHGREHAFDELAQARLELLRDPDESLATHATELQLAREPDLGEGLCVTAHVHPRGHRVLFIINPGSEPRRATLPAEISGPPRATSCCRPRNGGRWATALLVARQSVRMLLVPADPANGATP
jgi:hypothetical protein